MASFGRMLLFMGLVLILLGGIFILGERFGFGKLPGDIFIQRGGNFTFFFPIVSTLLISIILTLLINIFIRR